MFLFLAVLVLPFLLGCVSAQGLDCVFYLSRRLSGVFHYDQRIRYSLTFVAAKLACEQDFGAVVATRDQLHTAYLAGLEGCRAGWISSGEVAYPRIHRNWNCGQNRVGIISYGVKKNLLEKWDVYCYKLDDDCSAYNKSLQLEDKTSNSKSVNLFLGVIIPSSWKNVSKKQEIAETDLTQIQNKTTLFPNAVIPSYHSENIKDLYDSENLTSISTYVTFAENSTASSIDSSEKDNVKELVKSFLTENNDKSSNSRYPLQTERDKIIAASQLGVNWAKFEMVNNLTNETKIGYYSKVKSNSTVISSEITAEMLQIWNVTVDEPLKTTKRDNDSAHKSFKPSQAPLKFKNSPTGRGIPYMRTLYQHEVTTVTHQLPKHTLLSKVNMAEAYLGSPDLTNKFQSNTHSDLTNSFLLTDQNKKFIFEGKYGGLNEMTSTKFTEPILKHSSSVYEDQQDFMVGNISLETLESAKHVANSVMTSQTVQPNMHLVTEKQKSPTQISSFTRGSTVADDKLGRAVTNTFETETSSPVISIVTPGPPSEYAINGTKDPHHQSVSKPNGNSFNILGQFPSSGSSNMVWKDEHLDAINNTHLLLDLEKSITEMSRSDKSDLPIQIERYFNEGKIGQLDTVDTKEKMILGKVVKDWTAPQLTPHTHLPASLSIASRLDNTALAEMTTIENSFHPNTLKVEDIPHHAENKQGHHLDSIRRGETTLSGTTSDYEVGLNHLLISGTGLPQSVERTIQLPISSLDVTAFPGTSAPGINVESITFKAQSFAQAAEPRVDQQGKVNIKSNIILNNDEEKSFGSRVNDGMKLYTPVTHNTGSQETVSSEKNAYEDATSEINTVQQIAYSIDHTFQPVLPVDSSVLSRFTTPFGKFQQSTGSESMESIISTGEIILQPTISSGDTRKMQNNLVPQKESLNKESHFQTHMHSLGDVQQFITPKAEDKAPVNVTTTENDLRITRKDGKDQPSVAKGTSTLQDVITTANIVEPLFRLTEKSIVQHSAEGVSEAISRKSTGTQRDQVVKGTEEAPIPKEETSQYDVTHMTDMEIFSSLDVKDVANITDPVTEFLSSAASSISPVAVQTSVAYGHLLSTLASHFVVTEIPPKQDNVHPSTSSLVTSDSCGGMMRQTEGRFQTPHYPQSYPSNMDCTWEIEAPPGHLIRLDFTSLFIEEHRTCKYDYVVVYDGKGPSKVEMGRFCGSEVPPQLQGSSNTMSITMRSDSSMELEGFSAQFSIFQIPGGYIHLVEGKNKYNGIIEIVTDGHWGGICAKQWTNRDAMVVCRQLGFNGPALATRVEVSQQDMPEAIPYIKCNGDEMTLQDCDIRRSGKCTTSERAAVICQVMESCAALKSAGFLESGVFTIDPDGLERGVDPFPVECDMISDSATGITVIGHDSEDRIRVSPCEDAGCYSRTINYNQASLDQLKSLTETSKYCEQYISLECRHIRFLKQRWGWWVSRDGHKINSWGGASTDSGKCACGENGNCALGLSTCNCDANDGVWRHDKGYLTDKTILPAQEVRFGDTRDVPVEMAFHKIGPLRCYGQGSKVSVLESCAVLKEAGFQKSQRYIIDPDGAGTGVPQFEVFCDMTSDQLTAITIVSHDSERRTRVSPCEEPGCFRREINYEAELIQLNALTRISESCEQHVKLDCRHIRFIQAGWGWWMSWDGRRMFYWGDASPDRGGCACGMTESCSVPGMLCNCDSNDHIWRTDEGTLRDKTSLPIQAVHFGDTKGAPLEMAFYTIGKFMCKGKAGTQKIYQSL
ncbi:uncharacterized protein [Scyliorhinus torazame]|uniref:uncharacterized protein n=1 Tax=Scyliorhinus torazame TaxID=75743 RepID=UPI003B599C92